jgi:hypothetical protein
VKRGGGDHRIDREERWWGSQGDTKELELSNLLLVFFMYGDCTWHMTGIVKSDSPIVIWFSNLVTEKKLKRGLAVGGMLKKQTCLGWEATECLCVRWRPSRTCLEPSRGALAGWYSPLPWGFESPIYWPMWEACIPDPWRNKRVGVVQSFV